MKKYFTFVALGLMCLSLSLMARPVKDIQIIPQPSSVKVLKGSFNAAGKSFFCDPKFGDLAKLNIDRFANRLSLVSGKMSTTSVGVANMNFVPNEGFVFIKDANIALEGYELLVTKKSVVVKASDENGVIYAIETIKQLLPTDIYGKEQAKDVKYSIPCIDIKDAPRFAYRGMLLDCARHYFSVQEIKRFLDMLAVHKMNRFHWHLTDDQGWRIEIKKLPRLKEISAYRNGTIIKKDWDSNDGIRYGYCYSQEEIKEIVNYASSLGITIIPEIDLPGHMLGALAAYPELGCTGGPYEVWKSWGVSDEVLCVGKEETFKFLETVLGEVMDLFPSEYIHIGGDECPKNRWKECPACQAKIKELGLKDDDKHTKESYLQNYVTARVQKFVNDHGKKIIGWDEILEGDLAKGATVMSWQGVSGGIEAAKRGYDAIMSPNSFLYFDYYQSSEIDKEPFGIGGNLPIEKVYSYEPYDGMPENAQKHILGVQANLWTEYVATPEHLEYMILPRMAALSEIQWSPASEKNFERFKESLKHEFSMYDKMGYTYSKAIYGVYGY